MKIKFLAVTQAPDFYSLSGQAVEAHLNSSKEAYDLSGFPVEGYFSGADPVEGVTAIRHVERIGGELTLTLTQQVIAGQYPDKKAHWRESPIIDADDYDPNKCYVIPTGMAGVDDYEILQGVDVAGNTGWTVRKKEMADG